MTLLADLEEFVAHHRARGPLTEDARRGVERLSAHRRLPVGSCSSGWVTPEDAERDLGSLELREDGHVKPTGLPWSTG